MKRERSNQRPAPSLPLAGTDRGGGVGANPEKVAPISPPPNSAAPAASDLVLLGEFGRAHGLKGEVRLKSYTGDPLAIASYGPLTSARGHSYIIRNPRQAPGNAPEMLVVRVDGVTSREAAEALARVEVFVSRAKLPAVEDEDEFWLADLVGLSVRREDGTVIGAIVAVPNFGGGDLLEIRPAAGGATAFLPFTRAFVPVVKIAERYVVVDPPADLFAAAKPQGDEDEA